MIATAETHLDGDARTLNIQLANLSAADVRFIQGVCALFTDPARAEQLKALRNGEAALYSIKGQACCLFHETIREIMSDEEIAEFARN